MSAASTRTPTPSQTSTTGEHDSINTTAFKRLFSQGQPGLRFQHLGAVCSTGTRILPAEGVNGTYNEELFTQEALRYQAHAVFRLT